MIILGLDVASVDTGWAVLKFHEDGPPSLLDYGLIHVVAGWKIGKRLWHFRDQLTKVIHNSKASHPVVERPFIHRRTAVEAIYRFHGVVQELVYDIMQQEVVPMEVGKIRSRLGVAGKKKGVDPKEPVRLLVNRKFGINLTEKEYDISDAIAVAWSGYSEVRRIGKAQAKKAAGKKKKGKG